MDFHGGFLTISHTSGEDDFTSFAQVYGVKIHSHASFNVFNHSADFAEVEFIEVLHVGYVVGFFQLKL